MHKGILQSRLIWPTEFYMGSPSRFYATEFNCSSWLSLCAVIAYSRVNCIGERKGFCLFSVCWKISFSFSVDSYVWIFHALSETKAPIFRDPLIDEVGLLVTSSHVGRPYLCHFAFISKRHFLEVFKFIMRKAISITYLKRKKNLILIIASCVIHVYLSIWHNHIQRNKLLLSMHICVLL